MKNWEELGVKLMLQIGGVWGNNDPSRITATDLSKRLNLKMGRGRFVEALIKYFVSNARYHGLLMSWYFPGCPLVIDY